MRTLRSFVRIVDRHTVAVTALALVSTWLSIRFGILADLPSALIGVAVIFPIVFSINSAYRRREEALRALASAKAHAVAIAWAHRDWLGDREDLAESGRRRIRDLFAAIRRFFHAGAGEHPEILLEVYRAFSSISASHEELRAAGMPANEVSRTNQYLRAVMIEFERMRAILEYRTPHALRAYSRVFLNSFPVLYGPYFATLSAGSIPAVGYLVAVLYSVVLVSLDNIQEALENPYGTVDEDDVDAGVEDELDRILLATEGRER
jgi:hypothetical protein